MPVSLTRFANGKTALALILISSMVLGAVALKPASASGDFWTSKAPMHVARNGLGVAVVNGKIYAIGGSTESGENVNIGGIVGTNEEYDPTTNSWVFKESMPTPRRDFSIFAFRGKVYCVGGVVGYNSSGGIATAANEVYDPITDTWQTRKPAPTLRAGVSANVVGDKIYFVGGSPNYTLSEIYYPATDSWTTKSPMPNGRTRAYDSAAINNKLYFMDAYEPKLTVYNTETDDWSYGSPPPSTAYQGAAAATTGAFAPIRIYFLGLIGFMDQGSMPNRIYDPRTESWTLGSEVPTNRQGFAIGVINDTLYVIGGRSFTFPYPSDSPYIITQSAANEAYTPIGYGTPDPDYQPPTPSPSPSPSASPSPTPSPEPQQIDQFPVTWIIAAVTAAVIGIILLVYLKKHHH